MHALKHIDDQQYVSHVLTNVVKPDMEHVAKFWNDAGFDLWEEVRGLHFFTAMVQSRALREAMDVFWVAGDQGAAEYYREQHQKLAIKIEEFWNYRNGGTFQSHLDLGSKPTGVDAGNLLAVLHGAGGIAPLYRPSSAKTLASLASLVKAMQPLYPLNAHLKQGVAIGRYPSDIYDGSGTSIGNPWFLCTSAVAEILYLAASEIETVKQFQVNNINKNFAQMLDGGLQADTVVKGRALSELLGKMRTLGDDFLAVQQQFVTANLSMSEQYSRQDGHQLGARDLTWSYAAFYSAVEAREGQLTYEYS
jgi:glucoamylase